MVNWINIKDELPPKGERVLTYGGWGLVMDQLSVLSPNGAIWFRGNRDDYNTEVTHWARINLPE
jgi:hypothetical protein